VLGGVVVDLAHGFALFDQAEEVDGKHLFVGEVWVGVIALAWGQRFDAAGASANEQVDPNERKLNSMSPRAALQEGVEHPLQATCGGVIFLTLGWHIR